jgi:hypothetical protein
LATILANFQITHHSIFAVAGGSSRAAGIAAGELAGPIRRARRDRVAARRAGALGHIPPTAGISRMKHSFLPCSVYAFALCALIFSHHATNAPLKLFVVRP